MYRLSHGEKTLGKMSVDLFFIISGFLILRSWQRATSMQDYFRKRVLRIHPGFMVALVVSTFIAFLTVPSPVEYFHKLPKLDFLKSFVTLHYGVIELPKLAFMDNPFPAVNGSLWTIQIEFMAYIGIAAYGLFGLYNYRKAWLLLILYAGARYTKRVLLQGDTHSSGDFAFYFILGASFYLYRDVIPRSTVLFGVCLAALIGGLFIKPWFLLVLPASISYILFYIVMRPIPEWGHLTSKMDLSYGTYLYGFVVQQSVIRWCHVQNPASVFLLSLPITLAFAMASWFLVERPCLRMKTVDFPSKKNPSMV